MNRLGIGSRLAIPVCGPPLPSSQVHILNPRTTHPPQIFERGSKYHMSALSCKTLTASSTRKVSRERHSLQTAGRPFDSEANGVIVAREQIREKPIHVTRIHPPAVLEPGKGRWEVGLLGLQKSGELSRGL